MQVREADYERPETLAAAFAGAGQLLLVSGSEMGRRVPQHQAVADAAITQAVSTGTSPAATATATAPAPTTPPPS